MDNKEILDTLKAAKQYLSRLKLLDNEIESAVKQIINTFEETEKNIHETFSNLKDSLVNILNKRENCLLDQAKKARKDGLAPLEECRIVILEKIETTNKLINIGNSVINGSSDNLDKFTKDACLLGSLPEVPELKEVPFISFHYEPTSEIEVKDILGQFGDVCRIAPIQITELIEKPGAILVEWQSIENEDRMTDIQEFRLQRAFGDVIMEKHLLVNFNDCYKGLETQFLVKDLQVDQPYSFRVCCKFEGTLEWSPWSLPQVSKTTLMPFSWKTHEDYFMSNDNKIAKPIKNSPRVLYSDGPQFCVGHSVEFTFLDVDPSDAIVGLASENHYNTFCDLNSAWENSFFINRNGRIFVDGVEKATRLSDFTTGLKVCFTCDLVNDQKVRVNIDSNDKRVTYDWLINPNSKMFFFLTIFFIELESNGGIIFFK
ncbi:hypothetical protein NQ314_015105 [Rhamnusium bicolor]|uniref:Fibronectin type-III domain-containing protein n=1 Tax=Rhamnusium bicolor TaxID=1586634 RepID=A0AAV8WZR4_9CUCU|nr:hypothetical protein NQ314_015105 [Rhamnusium bicolor]